MFTFDCLDVLDAVATTTPERFARVTGYWQHLVVVGAENGSGNGIASLHVNGMLVRQSPPVASHELDSAVVPLGLDAYELDLLYMAILDRSFNENEVLERYTIIYGDSGSYRMSLDSESTSPVIVRLGTDEDCFPPP